MSADFLAGYISGAAGILIGNPLDLIKVRLQSGPPSVPSSVPAPAYFSSYGSLIRGATAPILGYGALNALLFVTYNRTSSFLTQTQGQDTQPILWTTWVAGAVGGLATWAVSTPTELVKCRAQVASSGAAMNSWGITKEILRREGVKGLYAGGVITALRDSVGYGFYFWSYELSTKFLEERMKGEVGSAGQEATKVLLCGGLAGVITWASVFPLDVVKTRVQTQFLGASENTALLTGNVVGGPTQRRLGAVAIAKNAYRNEGIRVFFRGLGICSVRAFVVNAVQWAVYEWMMRELDPKRRIEGSIVQDVLLPRGKLTSVAHILGIDISHIWNVPLHFDLSGAKSLKEEIWIT
ncbi:Carnitine acylcarnitine translocase [Hyphodiscus hymeniophilus]|uniref:Carnitine acylcarnitine translocase n=1 Tax=Hyphodiscus hymeniophilus TaxID=353542 RepID=A0A9P6VG99_9HELO|nr:Carnitine acylcarnitine translocase [Hyphodiscus hymeniophilus]